MIIASPIRAFALIACMTLVCSCTRELSPHPPNILYGQQECAFCGMIISDDRFASALIIDDAGEFQPLAFDDIDCMLRYEREHERLAVAARYVRGPEGWLVAEHAAYLHCKSLHTPMGSGLCASASIEGARELQRECSGELFDWTALRDRDAEHAPSPGLSDRSLEP